MRKHCEPHVDDFPICQWMARKCRLISNTTNRNSLWDGNGYLIFRKLLVAFEGSGMRITSLIRLLNLGRNIFIVFHAWRRFSKGWIENIRYNFRLNSPAYAHLNTSLRVHFATFGIYKKSRWDESSALLKNENGAIIFSVNIQAKF